MSVVAIGASAGGLAALRQFFAVMPADSGFAFVLIQHLDPSHESLTARLIGQNIAMSVSQAEDRVRIEPNHVYVIPPNKYLAIQDSVLRLSEPVLQRGVRMPIDHFLRSLAAEQGERAVGVLLSGTGSDGTLGLREVKVAGGMTLAQSPATAQYNGMVLSAINAGLVDFVVDIEAMPEILTGYIQHHAVLHKAAKSPHSEVELQPILKLLKQHTGYDFHGYKEGTLIRRVLRRMGLHHMQKLRQYADFLRDHPEETSRLFKDLLISVTGFFREPEAFERLAQEVVAQQLQTELHTALQTDTGEPIRIWVPGCATGEEAYSLAILYMEQMQALQVERQLQIFATDIDDQALEVARSGVYPEGIAIQVSPQRLQQFFHQQDSHYQVAKKIRDCVTFAHQNLISDPPFSKIDLISCRNLIIYLQSELQRKVMGLFHFALRQNGYLMLGNSESVGYQTELFKVVDKKLRIFQRRETGRRHAIDFPRAWMAPTIAATSGDVEKPSVSGPAQLAEAARGILLQNYAPAAVLVNSKYQIEFYHGSMDRYLTRRSGVPSADLFSQLRDGLQLRLRSALQEAIAEDRRVSVAGVSVLLDDDKSMRVRVTVEPIRSMKARNDLLLVVFEDEPDTIIGSPEAADKDYQLLQQWERELQNSRDDLQCTIEELETTNEELKSANEEIMSMNEELQSSNEELESSREELQSMNEEINTVNSELQLKVEELERLNNDLNNLLASTNIATLFLDRQGRIKRFTPAAKKLFNLIATDVGRPIGDISHHFLGLDVYRDAQVVLDCLAVRERELLTDDGGCYIQRILPYQTEKFNIDGAVVTYIDITERKQNEETLQRLAAVMRDSNDAVTVMDDEGIILDWNRGAEKTYGWSKADVVGKSLFEIAPADQHPDLQGVVEQLCRGQRVESVEIKRSTRDGKMLDVWLTGTAITGETGAATAVAITERDITARKQAEQSLRTAKQAAEQATLQKSQFLAAASHDLRQPLQTLEFLNSALSQSSLPADSHGQLEQQAEALAVMRDLLNNLLDINQLDSGIVKPAPSTVSVRELFAELAQQFHAQALQKGLLLKFRPRSIQVRSDKVLLERIMANFVSNALKYTARGGVLVSARLRAGCVRLQVWDTGCGIAADEVEHIFDEFYQVDNAARQRRLGIGLGLTIAERMARLLGHPLQVRSRLEKGSVFSIDVPLVATAELPFDPQQRAAATTARRAAANGSQVGASVLLIEDDPLVALALERLLQKLGYKVHCCREGQGARDCLNAAEYAVDLIISDYRLPGDCNGLDLIQQLRRTTGRDTPAILLTGDTLGIDIALTEKVGCKLMFKPVDGWQLQEAMQQLLRGSGRFSVTGNT